MVKKSSKRLEGNDNILVKISMLFFKNWKVTLLLWVLILGFGAATYTSLIKREGFPPIQFPLTLVQGTYFVDDKEKVDNEVTQPLTELLLSVEGVTEVSTTAGANFFSALVSFEDTVKSEEGAASVAAVIDSATNLPDQVNPSVLGIDPGSFLFEFDMLLSVYSTEPTEVVKIQEVADFVAKDFQKEPLITRTEVQPLLETGINPLTGLNETRQTSFNQIGLQDNNELGFFQSVTIGIVRDESQLDIIELSELANQRINELDLSQFGDNYRVVIGADFASSIENQITSLESNLSSGLLAVVVVTLLLITWRASVITAAFMVSVVATTVAVLYVVGYSLNTITLFALVLALGLFVDDATIAVESIVASKDKKKKQIDIVRTAVRKIGAASFAGTFTTVLVFLPLAFLSGILGEFIRLMPITIIIALITSLLMSLTIIPVLAKFLLLKDSKLKPMSRFSVIARAESYLGKKAGSLPRLLKTAPKKGKIVATAMIFLSLGFLIGGGSYATKLSFNIFPPSKDSDQISFAIDYPDVFTIEQAESVANDINNIIKEEIGDAVVRVSYGSNSQSNARQAGAIIELVSFNDRDIKSPDIISRLSEAFDESIQDDISVRVTQIDAGPPVSEFPLQIQIIEEDLEVALELAASVEQHINNASLERANGTTAEIYSTQPATESTINRTDGKRVLTVGGAFNADDTSALLAVSQTYVEDKFTREFLDANGFASSELGFNFGQESENADSFSSLLYAFPIALLLMYVLLALQFRSWLQPLLIFTAIPFTFLGVFAGLYYTDNALSFFVQVGLIGLIGIAVNNTILLTEYANQEKRAGVGTIDAIANAVTKRFRPLVTTTLTTVVALLPLALSDPFWESLAFTIIFGLLSSTFLVVLSFPYFYLAAEWLGMRFSKGSRQARSKNRSIVN